MPKNTLNWLAFLLAIVVSAPAVAHEGHGLAGSHWHPTDAWGFGALITAFVVAVWLSRGGK
jgi:hypothetical protein